MKHCEKHFTKHLIYSPQIKVKTDLGGSCSIEEQCAVEFATCAGEEDNYKCMCQKGYVQEPEDPKDPDKKDRCFEGMITSKRQKRQINLASLFSQLK